jgi:hypothetical protein
MAIGRWPTAQRFLARTVRGGPRKDEARASLAEAVALILEDRREDWLRGVPADAERDTVIVE